MAIDPGSKRIGLALSDETRTIASPYRTLTAEPAASLVDRLVAILREAGAERILVGLPKNMDGSSGPEAKAARVLAEHLRVASGLPVEMIDERLSSVAAERHLVRGGMRREKRRLVVDQVAATLLLQSWLDGHRAR
jgi:putative Holliday junction resolvase